MWIRSQAFAPASHGSQASRGPRHWCALVAACVLASCAVGDSERRGTTEPDPGRPGITVIRSQSFWFDWDRRIEPADADLERGIADAIQVRLPDLRYISRAQFCRAVFPDLPAASAPLELRSIRVLIEEPEFRRRLAALNLRYLVYVSGRTEIEEEHAWAGVATYGFGTFGGSSVWDKKTVLGALVFDLRRPTQLERTTHTARGKAWIAGVFPIIVGAPADPEGRAAQKLGEQLIQTLAAARELEAGR